jgi:hypothetical protein
MNSKKTHVDEIFLLWPHQKKLALQAIRPHHLPAKIVDP